MLGDDNEIFKLTLMGILTPACIILGWPCWIMPGCLIMFMPPGTMPPPTLLTMVLGPDMMVAGPGPIPPILIPGLIGPPPIMLGCPGPMEDAGVFMSLAMEFMGAMETSPWGGMPGPPMELMVSLLILLFGVEEGAGPRTLVSWPGALPDRAFTKVMFWLGLAMVPIGFIPIPPGLIPIPMLEGVIPVVVMLLLTELPVDMEEPTIPSREPLDKPLELPLSQFPDRISSGNSSLRERRSKYFNL